MYAAETSVSSEKSRAEIEKTLMRYGASHFMYGTGPDRAIVAFEMDGKRVQFNLPMPSRNDRRFTHTEGRGTERSPEKAAAEYDKGVRQRWRALALVIKAKLEAVESGITMFEEEFMAHIMLPDGKTVGQFMLPQIEKSYKSGKMPPLLPHLPED